jgi:hypothetical protein
MQNAALKKTHDQHPPKPKTTKRRTNKQLEFFAEEEPITIIPSFSLRNSPTGMLRCVGGDYGPFRPNMPVEVPIWLALQLYKRGKCRILPPAFLDVGRLQGACFWGGGGAGSGILACANAK